MRLQIVFITLIVFLNCATADDIDPNYNYDTFMIQYDRTYTGQ